MDGARSRRHHDDLTADAFRHFYDCDFSENRNIWDKYVAPLSDEQLTQNLSYSNGSVRNQVVHLLDVDDAWFSGLRGALIADSPDPAALANGRTRCNSSSRTATASS